MDNKKVIDINIKKNLAKKQLKKYVYSLRINTEQRQLLVKNAEIKKELDKLVKWYLEIYLKEL